MAEIYQDVNSFDAIPFSFALYKSMRLRIGIILAYLLLGCILLEDALPYFADSNMMQLCESKSESEEKDSKKEIEDTWKEVKERLQPSYLYYHDSLMHLGSIFADSDEILDSAHQSIFSPPPDRA